MKIKLYSTVILIIIIIQTKGFSADIKLKNGIQYVNTKIVLKDRVFPKLNNQLEFSTILGQSEGNLVVKYDEIYDIEVKEPLIPIEIIDNKNVVIKDINNKVLNNPVSLSPFDIIKTNESGNLKIGRDSVPYFQFGPKTEIHTSIEHIKPTKIFKGTFDQASVDLSKEKEELIYHLISGNVSGIFDYKNNEYNYGFILDTKYIRMTIKSPKFYINYTVTDKNERLTVFVIKGSIEMFHKPTSQSFPITEGKFTELYGQYELLQPSSYKDSPELLKIYNLLENK